MGVLWGAHNQTLGGGARDSLIRGRAAVVVTTDPTSSDWANVKAEAGIELLFGRLVRNDANLEPTPEAAAERYYAEDRLTMLACPWVDGWISPWNERLYKRGDLVNRARAEHRYCELATADGLKIAVGGFSVGTPEPDDLAAEYTAALELAWWIVVHEYWTYGRLEQPWWTGRWRRLLEALPDYLRRPVLIAEAGLDYHVVGQGDADAGWKHNGIGIGQYRDDLDAYRRQVEADVAATGATVAVCIYQVGSLPPWESFDLAGYASFERWLSERRDDNEHPVVPTTPVVDVVSTAPTGYDKAEPLIGPYLHPGQRDIYFEAGTEHEVGGAVGERGFLIWNRRTNESLVYVTEGQQVYRDDGNLRQGVLRRIG